jgi:hypothetical protein
LVGRRQIVARERIKMSGGAEHPFVPPSVARISPFGARTPM